MSNEKKKFRVFFSWQSDLPEKSNRNSIRKALNDASKKLKGSDPKLEIDLDEATRNIPGSPNIALKILEKINASDIFVADVTPITIAGKKKPCPNPNVSYELGYAVAQLGWDRVILLFNQAHGKLSTDLPFDFSQNRVSLFEIDESLDKAKCAALANLLKTALNAIILTCPKRPAERQELSRDKVEHNRDVESMKRLMSGLHLPTLDCLIRELPHSIPERSMDFLECLRGNVEGSSFFLYDSVLSDAINRLLDSWSEAVSHYGEYVSAPGGHNYIFHNPGDMRLSPERKKIWDEIDRSRSEMSVALDDILSRLRESYIEISIDETNSIALKTYLDCVNEINSVFEDRTSKGK